MSRSVRRRRDITTIVRVLLVALAFITPAVFDLGAVKPFDIVKVTAVWFFGALIFGIWLAAAALGRSRPRGFLMGWLVAGYLAVATLATIFSRTPLTAIFGWYGRYGGLTTIVAYVLVFVVIACVYRERRDRTHELVYAMAAGAIVLTAYILIQWLGIDPIRWSRPSGEIPGQPYFGTMGNANFAGGYLGLTAPWVFLAYRRARSIRARALVAAAGAAQLGALWLTSARNGMVALAFAVGALLFIERRRVPALLKIGAAAVAAVAVLLAVIVIWHPGSDEPPRAFRGVDVLRSETIQVRGYWWLAGIKMFADRPVIGWGPDSYVTEYPKYMPRTAARLGDAETADKPHNVFVEHLAHTGILGFAAYIALLIVAFRRAFRRLRNAGREEAALMSTLIALLAGYVGQAFFSIDVTAIGLVGWVALGCIAALADPPDDTAPSTPAPTRPSARARVLAGVAIVVAAALAALSTAPLKADHESRTARRLSSADAFIDDVREHLDRSQIWQPWVPQYRAIEGEYLARQAQASSDRDVKRDLLVDAVDNYEQTDRLQPGYHAWKMTIGKAVGDLAAAGGASFDDAYRWLDEAHRLAPYDWRVLVNRGDVYNLEATATKDTDLMCRALRDYRRAVALHPIASGGWQGLGRTLARLGHLERAIRPLKKAAKRDQVNDSPKPAERLITEVEKLQRSEKRPPKIDCN